MVPGDVVILETAACYNRYHAALYRTIFVGDVPALAEDAILAVKCHRQPLLGSWLRS